MKKTALEQFESVAQQLLEHSVGRLLGGRIDPIQLSAEIARAIEEQQRNEFAPNIYTIQLHPSDYSYISLKWPDISIILRHYIVELSQQWGLQLASDPVVELVANPKISRHYAQIEVTHQLTLEDTTYYLPSTKYDPLIALRELDAFLIVNGTKHFPLDRPTLTIGRSEECDLVIPDIAVSRKHAQIRWQFGRFILHDLGSRGGCLVNDHRVEEFVLRVGDVIRLSADSTLIYAEERNQSASADVESADNPTEPLPSIIGKRSTIQS